MVSEAPDSQTLSILLDEAKDSAQRVECLLPLVYDQLRAVAQRAMAAERPDHTLQATALVHEAYLKLVGEREIPGAYEFQGESTCPWDCESAPQGTVGINDFLALLGARGRCP